MKHNAVGTIAVANSKRPRARFNLSGDVHTSMDFGSVIPARCQFVLPNSKLVMSSKERVLCSPMLAPTMGRMSLKCYHDFVRLSDLTKNFAPMLSQEAVNRGDTSFVPLSVPQIQLRSLSYFVLSGSYLNVYKLNVGSESSDSSGCTASVYSGTTGILTSDADLSALGLFNKLSWSRFDLGNSFNLDIDTLFFGAGTHTSYHSVVLSNPENATFYPVDPSCPFALGNSKYYDLSDVTPSNADYVLPVTVGSDTFYLCFRLSDFGKRLRKILIGCGYQIDFTSTQSVSLLPLFAFYKAYFDVFGLTLYTNWEQSYCYSFLKRSDLYPTNDLSSYWDLSWNLNAVTSESIFYNFILRELGLCYYTDEQDFVSAHTTSESVSPAPSGVLDPVIDVDNLSGNAYAPNIDVASIAAGLNGNSNLNPSTSTNLSGHAFIDSVIHGQLDSEFLKRLYRYTNRNTIAGRRIAEILRTQGLGSYVDECKSDFIGSFELPINVYDGISQSDTFDSVADSGAPLGERFGNGQASSSENRDCERSFVFETNEHGFWITLIAVVPKGGYVETLDPAVLAKSKFEYPTPDFDSLGMEFDPKSLVQGSMPFADFNAANGRLQDSFGLVPRYFRWKFGRSSINGDFSRRSVRDSFSPYHLDKLIDVGSRSVVDVSVSSTAKIYSITKIFKASMLPIAGNVWRYPTRYPFLSRFNRIFNRLGASYDIVSNLDASSFAVFEFFSNSDDNFILHMIFDEQYFAPMLPVEDSFETYDDDNAPNGHLDKA